jgi:all-trans-8'-apo-beta-carotenal 15,15'-oxygenase
MNIALKQQLPLKPRVLPGCELGGYETLFDESSYWIDSRKVVGEIPEGLEGTLFLNCPGRNKIGDQQFGHWFDGDGMISAVIMSLLARCPNLAGSAGSTAECDRCLTFDQHDTA